MSSGYFPSSALTSPLIWYRVVGGCRDCSGLVAWRWPRKVAERTGLSREKWPSSRALAEKSGRDNGPRPTEVAEITGQGRRKWPRTRVVADGSRREHGSWPTEVADITGRGPTEVAESTGRGRRKLPISRVEADGSGREHGSWPTEVAESTGRGRRKWPISRVEADGSGREHRSWPTEVGRDHGPWPRELAERSGRVVGRRKTLTKRRPLSSSSLNQALIPICCGNQTKNKSGTTRFTWFDQIDLRPRARQNEIPLYQKESTSTMKP
ncbi:uncharacterized protein J3R85_011394 [Psidium guajava]|nr:uncharacterized protein J3R85_011394 [Psidium guajava]